MKIKVGAFAELGDGEVKVFDQDGCEGIVVRSGDAIYACERYCSHELFPLEFGLMQDPTTLRCTFHGAMFDIRTGAVLGPPATVGLKTYAVSVENGEIVVDVPDR